MFNFLIAIERKAILMRQLIGRLTSFCFGSLLVLAPVAVATADDSQDASKAKSVPTQSKAAKPRAKTVKPQSKDDQEARNNLLTAMNDGSVSVEAVGRGDGRMTLSVTNNTRRPLHVILPPGLIAQSATGQFGGMGGAWAAVWVAWAVAWVAWAAAWVAWAVAWVAWAAVWVAWVVVAVAWVAWVVWASVGHHAPDDGHDDAARMIMYFCGDPESWDMRSLMIGMMGGMGGGMGGMGGGMGGMGGGVWVVWAAVCDPFQRLNCRLRFSIPADAKLTDPAGEHHGARS